MPARSADSIRSLLADAATAAGDALAAFVARSADGAAVRRRGERPGQYRLDLAVDAAVLEVLDGAGVGVLSEESGLHERGTGLVVVVDPVDGSTNASRHLPWHACSLCAVDEQGPWISLVVNLATGTRWSATRGEGAERDGTPVSTSATRSMAEALVVLNGYPPTHLGWRQYRSLGATALDLCAVGDGSVDATIDCTVDNLGPWDYMGAMLVVREAGGVIGDVRGRDMVTLEADARRTPVSAATETLWDEAMAARGAF